MKKVLSILVILTLSLFVYSQEISEGISSEEEDFITEEQRGQTPITAIADNALETVEQQEEVVQVPDSAKLEKELKINQQKDAIKNYVNGNWDKLTDMIDPLDVIEYIEALKTDIDNRRKEIAAQESEWIAVKDAEVEKTVDSIINAPLEVIEMDSFQTQTKESIARRKAAAQKVIDDAEAEKKAFSKNLWDSIKPEEKDKLSYLNKLYSTLELFNYKTTTFTKQLSISVGTFDGVHGKWKATISSDLFGVTSLVNETVELTYSEVTGKKYIPVDKMKDAQFEEFNFNVDLYNALFQAEVPALYAKLYYKVIRWQNASEYRFMPSKIDIVRINGEKEKVIHTIDNVPVKIFTKIPIVEVRDEKTIAKEKTKSVNRLEREQKQKEKKLGTKLYSDPDVAAKTYGKDPVIQKGRGTVLLSIADYEDFNEASVAIDHLQLTATFGLGKFGFLGGEFGINFPFTADDVVLGGGLLGGFSVHAGRVMRPYLYVGADYFSDYTLAPKGGLGCDFIFAKVFCLNLNYGFNWNMGMNEYMNQEARQARISQGEDLNIPMWQTHTFSLGAGVAW